MTNKNWKIADAALEAVLDSYSRDLTAEAAKKRMTLPDSFQGNILETIKALCNRKAASVCIIGEPGSGKTALISGAAQYIVDGVNVPESLQGARVILLDINAMSAGASFKGQVEARLHTLAQGLKEREGFLNGQKIILASDDLPALLDDGAPAGSTIAGNVMKSLVMSKGISVVTSVTPQEYRSHIARDPGLSRHFQEIAMPGDGRHALTNGHALAEAFAAGAAQPVRVMRTLSLRRTAITL